MRRVVVAYQLRYRDHRDARDHIVLASWLYAAGFPSCRLVLTVMGFFALVNCYTLRVNLSVAIVAMVNQTYLHELEASASAADGNTSGSSHDVCAVEGDNKTHVKDENVRSPLSVMHAIAQRYNRVIIAYNL